MPAHCARVGRAPPVSAAPSQMVVGASDRISSALTAVVLARARYTSVWKPAMPVAPKAHSSRHSRRSACRQRQALAPTHGAMTSRQIVQRSRFSVAGSKSWRNARPAMKLPDHSSAAQARASAARRFAEGARAALVCGAAGVVTAEGARAMGSGLRRGETAPRSQSGGARRRAHGADVPPAWPRPAKSPGACGTGPFGPTIRRTKRGGVTCRTDLRAPTLRWN